jgi:hydrogenase/urease accessory protein HupE
MTKRFLKFSRTGMLAGILVLLLSGGARAHDPGLSAVEVRVLADRVVAEVSFAPADLEGVQQPASSFLTIYDNEIKLQLRSVSGGASDQKSVHFVFEFLRSDATQLRISAPVLRELPRGHKQFCSVSDQNNKVLVERMLTADVPDLTIDLSSAPANSRSPFSFVFLGIEHILTGFDHLAFLLALLLAGDSLRRNAKIITSFTVAHSLTLALATLGVVRISPAIVEPIIAASVVFVGLENLFGRRVAARWLVTFGFGLVHGLGFASALRELGIGGLGVRAFFPLLSFNVGVELAQIAIAALVLPLVWKLKQRPVFALKHVPALSLLITLAGVYWFLTRTLT